MRRSLDDLEQFLNEDVPLPVLIRCALLHYQFETIHPFLDGNGRLGRLLAVFYLVQQEVLPQPLLYLSPYFEDHRSEYYRVFKQFESRVAFKSGCSSSSRRRLCRPPMQSLVPSAWVTSASDTGVTSLPRAPEAVPVRSSI